MADLVTIEEVRAALNLGSDESHDTELGLYIDAATAHVEDRYGAMPSTEYTEIASTAYLGDGTVRLRASRRPVLEVSSIGDGTTTYTTGLTVTADGYIEHAQLTAGRWTLVYTAGFAAVPADLKLAALEDIRGLYQPGQIGPPGAFGAFGIEATDVGPTFRPVRMWPRVDAWIASRSLPAIA